MATATFIIQIIPFRGIETNFVPIFGIIFLYMKIYTGEAACQESIRKILSVTQT